MEILATFDGSKCSEAIIPQLEWMARAARRPFHAPVDCPPAP